MGAGFGWPLFVSRRICNLSRQCGSVGVFGGGTLLFVLSPCARASAAACLCGLPRQRLSDWAGRHTITSTRRRFTPQQLVAVTITSATRGYRSTTPISTAARTAASASGSMAARTRPEAPGLWPAPVAPPLTRASQYLSLGTSPPSVAAVYLAVVRTRVANRTNFTGLVIQAA